MSQRKTISLTLALIFAAGVAAPRTALGNRVLYEQPAASADASPAANTNATTTHATASTADTTDTPDAADDARQQKSAGGGFARALAAPFRALAKLFGGGRKSKADEAKKSTPQPASDSSAAQANAQGEMQSTTGAQSNTSVVSQGAPYVFNDGVEMLPLDQESGVLAGSVASIAQTSEGVRVVRPSENGDAELKPKMWIPLIVGVPADPLSQGRALLEHGYLPEAISELSIAASTVGPGLIEANNLLGLAYDRMGWHRLAAECYERALTVAPKDPVVLANLGYSLYLADDYEGALKSLKLAAKLAPGTPVIYNDLAVVHARLGHDGEAFKYFALASGDYDAHVKLAGILEDQKRDREAIRHYEAALRLQPGASAVLERLVALYERNGERDKADTARRALAQPRNPQKTATGGGD